MSVFLVLWIPMMATPSVVTMEINPGLTFPLPLQPRSTPYVRVPRALLLDSCLLGTLGLIPLHKKERADAIVLPLKSVPVLLDLVFLEPSLVTDSLPLDGFGGVGSPGVAFDTFLFGTRRSSVSRSGCYQTVYCWGEQESFKAVPAPFCFILCEDVEMQS